jgi:hypothetical protein
LFEWDILVLGDFMAIQIGAPWILVDGLKTQNAKLRQTITLMVNLAGCHSDGGIEDLLQDLDHIWELGKKQLDELKESDGQ